MLCRPALLVLVLVVVSLAADAEAPPAKAKGKGKGKGATFRKHPNASQYSNFWLKAYSKGAESDKRSIFMNWGYVPVDEPRCQATLPKGNTGETGCQLYLHLLRRAMRPLLGHEPASLERALVGKESLEVGCGRGAGSRLVADYLAPSLHTGLDLVEGQLAISRAATASLSNTRFVQGSAVALPFESNRFDLAFNVESSHTYPSWRRFACGVHRVLKPGGVFAWVDLAGLNLGLNPNNTVVGHYQKGCCGLEVVDSVTRMLATIGFEVLVVEDVLLNVLRSLEYEATLPYAGAAWSGGVDDFNALPGSNSFKVLQDTNRHYPILISRKLRADVSEFCRQVT